MRTKKKFNIYIVLHLNCLKLSEFPSAARTLRFISLKKAGLMHIERDVLSL